MAVISVTGSFSPGFFIPHGTLEDVDSGLPEWTLGEDGTPPAEPTEEDAEDDDDEDSDEEDSGDDHSAVPGWPLNLSASRGCGVPAAGVRRFRPLESFCAAATH
jgi:hypothetical protein